MRDKFTFPVGGGLTMKNIKFEALDSIAYYDTTTEVVTSMAKSETTCTLLGNLLDKCANKTITLAQTK